MYCSLHFKVWPFSFHFSSPYFARGPVAKESIHPLNGWPPFPISSELNPLAVFQRRYSVSLGRLAIPFTTYLYSPHFIYDFLGGSSRINYGAEAVILYLKIATQSFSQIKLI